MSVIHVVKSKGYTAMSNYHLRDQRLSLKARGLLSTILSLPDDWEYSVSGLSAICRENRDTIGTILRELEESGYVERSGQQREGGKFTAGDYTIFEIPPAELDENIHRAENTGTVKPARNIPHGEQGINNNLNNKLLKTKPPAPQKGDSRAIAEKILFDAVGNVPELKELISKFLDMRWKMKKPYKTSNGPTAAANKLRRLSDDQPWKMRKIIQQSLDHEWESFYELKEDKPRRGDLPPAQQPTKEASAWR